MQADRTTDKENDVSTQTTPESVLSTGQERRVVLAQKARGILTNTTLISSSGPSAKEVVKLATWLEGARDDDPPLWLTEAARDLLLDSVDKAVDDDRDDQDGQEYSAHECAPGVLPDEKKPDKGESQKSPAEREYRLICDRRSGVPGHPLETYCDSNEGHDTDHVFRVLVTDKPRWQVTSAQLAEHDRIRAARLAHFPAYVGAYDGMGRDV